MYLILFCLVMISIIVYILVQFFFDLFALINLPVEKCLHKFSIVTINL